LLAVIGDLKYKKDIAKLLKDKNHTLPKSEDNLESTFKNFDRSRAAMALGLMGAKEYAPNLSILLRSPDADDKAGATLGLGYMCAREYISNIANLLDDDNEQVQVSALEVLGEFDATEYSKKIASLLNSRTGSMVIETACYTLARFNSKEQASELARLLNERFRKGYAAKALALLGAKEYAENIVQLIEDDDPLVRSDALIALGILDNKDYINKIATHLQDKKIFVRAYAAVLYYL